MIRTGEPRHLELDLADATAAGLVDAIAAYPELIEQPMVIRADRAVVARSPELLLSLLGGGEVARAAARGCSPARGALRAHGARHFDVVMDDKGMSTVAQNTNCFRSRPLSCS